MLGSTWIACASVPFPMRACDIRLVPGATFRVHTWARPVLATATVLFAILMGATYFFKAVIANGVIVVGGQVVLLTLRARG